MQNHKENIWEVYVLQIGVHFHSCHYKFEATITLKWNLNHMWSYLYCALQEYAKDHRLVL